VISAIEHASVREAARFLERLGYDVTVVGVSGQGIVQPAAIREAIRPDTRLVSVMHASHEVGSIQPLRQIAEICHDHQIPLHTDAAQSIGKVRTQVDELEVDLLTLSGHKMHGPKGSGALYIRRGVELEPILHGDGQEGGLRAGMENVPAIVGLGRAAHLAATSLDQAAQRMTGLRDRLWQLLLEGIGPGLVLHARLAERLPNVLAVSFPGVSGHELLARAPEVCAATGSATHARTEAISPVLAAMGVPEAEARGTVRLSVHWYTGPDEIERATSLLVAAWEAVR
jgi:cysteine desulfurase